MPVMEQVPFSLVGGTGTRRKSAAMGRSPGSPQEVPELTGDQAAISEVIGLEA